MFGSNKIEKLQEKLLITQKYISNWTKKKNIEFGVLEPNICFVQMVFCSPAVMNPSFPQLIFVEAVNFFFQENGFICGAQDSWKPWICVSGRMLWRNARETRRLPWYFEFLTFTVIAKELFYILLFCEHFWRSVLDVRVYYTLLFTFDWYSSFFFFFFAILF